MLDMPAKYPLIMFSEWFEIDFFDYRKICYFGQYKKGGQMVYVMRFLHSGSVYVATITEAQRAEILANYKPTNKYSLTVEFAYQNSKIKGCTLQSFENSYKPPPQTKPESLEAHFEQNLIFNEFDLLQFYRDRHDDNEFSDGAQNAPKTWAYNGYLCFCFQCVGLTQNYRIKKFPRAPRLWRIKKKRSCRAFLAN